MGKSFFDTNVLFYVLSGDARKGPRAADILRQGGVISVQVLNELAAVALKKTVVAWDDLEAFLGEARDRFTVEALSVETHREALRISRRYQLGIYDSMIVAAALQAGCETVFSEHMQDGQVIGAVTVRNPFRT